MRKRSCLCKEQRQPAGARGGDAGCCWELDWGRGTLQSCRWIIFSLDEIVTPSPETNCDVNKPYLVLLILQPTLEKKDGLGSFPVLTSAKKMKPLFSLSHSLLKLLASFWSTTAVLLAVEYFLPWPLCLPPISNLRKLHLAWWGWKWSQGTGNGGKGCSWGGGQISHSLLSSCSSCPYLCLQREMLRNRRNGINCLWVLLLFLCLVQLILL